MTVCNVNVLHDKVIADNREMEDSLVKAHKLVVKSVACRHAGHKVGSAPTVIPETVMFANSI